MMIARLGTRNSRFARAGVGPGQENDFILTQNDCIVGTTAE